MTEVVVFTRITTRSGTIAAPPSCGPESALQMNGLSKPGLLGMGAQPVAGLVTAQLDGTIH
jgi:hypothetical protein